jgi:hypothetical protein
MIIWVGLINKPKPGLMKTFAAICNSKRLAPLILLLMLSIAGKAQISNKKLDSLITNKTNWYGIKTQEPTLFIHFDKLFM